MATATPWGGGTSPTAVSGRTDVARRGSATRRIDPDPGSPRRSVEGARLRPMRKVRRELVSPKGERVVVEVPVYPPFRLKSDAERGDAPG